jgi:hypothetical protein
VKPVIYLDMDGVLADFDTKAAELVGPKYKSEIQKPEWGAVGEIPELYSMLPLMPYAIELYEACCEVAGDRDLVRVLTALPKRASHKFPDAARHKIEWARKNIHPSLRVYFGPLAADKQHHVSSLNDVLIDDMKKNITQWTAAGGIGILHTSYRDTILQLAEVRRLLHPKG